LRAERRSGTTRWALQDVSFTLEPGDALGVIGHNGAGKSTLLRLASGISRPTRGRLMVTPSAASVLSLGDTFNADLSGASNAITAAVIGGLSPREARAALPRAIEFAELSEFQDAPVRSYSDGMKLRLAFGVMTLLTPDLLIVDEILAVGDLSFQEKCMAHLENLRERGTAIVLASHDMEQIREQCDEALLLSRGQVLAYGEVEEVVAAHREEMANRTLAVTPEASPQSGDDRLVLNTTRFGSQEIRIAKVEVGSRSGAGTVTAGGDLDIQITLEAGARAEPVAIAVAIERDGDDVKCVGLSTELDEVRVDTRPGSNVTVSLQLPLLELRPGQYWVDVGVFPDSWAHAYDYHYRAYALRVTGESDDPAEPVYRPVNRRWAVEDNA
jgi:lipopolysaccharide transport system ATP-binding protein